MRVMTQVTCCADCPFYGGTGSEDDGGDLVFCSHPMADESGIAGDQKPPTECPLRAGELLIQLRVKT